MSEATHNEGEEERAGKEEGPECGVIHRPWDDEAILRELLIVNREPEDLHPIDLFSLVECGEHLLTNILRQSSTPSSLCRSL